MQEVKQDRAMTTVFETYAPREERVLLVHRGDGRRAGAVVTSAADIVGEGMILPVPSEPGY